MPLELSIALGVIFSFCVGTVMGFVSGYNAAIKEIKEDEDIRF